MEALFDLGRHLVVKSGLGVPADYRAVIEKLKEGAVIPGDFARQIMGMAGYRDRLIHEYNKITPAELHEIILTRLADLTLFCQYVVDHLQKVPPQKQEKDLAGDNSEPGANTPADEEKREHQD